MAKVAILDDLEVIANLFSYPLVLDGHQTLVLTTPIDFERLVDFGPDVICLVLYRQKCAFDRPIEDLATDVLGFAPLVDMERYPAVNVIPILLLGNALQEQDIPTTVNYDLFLTFPNDIRIYLPKVNELATKVKSRRRISGYVCPNCGSRLVFVKVPVQDMFCPRCGTAVALIDHEGCTMLDPQGHPQPCTLDMLQPPTLGRHLGLHPGAATRREFGAIDQ